MPGVSIFARFTSYTIARIFVYNGTQESFSYDAKPYTKYDFELIAFKDLDKTIIIDRQLISVMTHSESIKKIYFRDFLILIMFIFRAYF